MDFTVGKDTRRGGMYYRKRHMEGGTVQGGKTRGGITLQWKDSRGTECTVQWKKTHEGRNRILRGDTWEKLYIVGGTHGGMTIH